VGVAIDTITAFKDNLTGGGFEALAAGSGDSLTLRFLDANADIRLLEAWGGNNVTKCDFSIRSPLLHDNTRGIRFAHMFNPTQSGADGNPQLYMSPYEFQKYRPSDTLTVEVSGAAADDATFTQLVWYEGPGVPDSKFIGFEECMSKAVNLVGIRVSPAGHATTSTYGTAEAINTDDDRLKANTWYALIGHTTDLPHTTLTIKGPETGNLRVPMPGSQIEQITAGWFLELARRFQKRMIPVFNANNKANIFVEVADAGGGTTPLTSLKFLELSSGPMGGF
jgi:hypothetical protein